MACSAAALATPVLTTASRPLPKSTRGVPAARRRPARSLAPRASADAASAATALSWPEGAGAAEIGTTKATASVVNLGARGEIATGLPFLDHMIDQLTSHAQLGVSVVVSRDGVASVPCVDASGTDEQDEAVARAAGAALGQALAQTLAPGVAAVAAGAAGSAEFAAPLDEAYSTCVLAVPASGVSSGSLRFELAPYGPEGSNGRARIGTYKTALTEPFWSALATHANLDVTLLKRRGDNAHHIVEATFKAFARCTRALMDQIEADVKSTSATDRDVTDAPNAEHRASRKARATKETTIDVAVDLDGVASATTVATGIRTLDALLLAMAEEASFQLNVDASGDLWIDDHHTTEDVAITVGQVLNEALGSKAGCNRMGRATARVGDARVEVIADLSNRPYLCNGLVFREETIGDLSTEMVDHLFMSVATNAQMTAHIVRADDGGGDEADVAEAAARAFGKCLKQCVAVDPRRAGAVASSKGTLSV
jgi:imidazoleglycerol-phosphate dehydratase